MQDKILKKLQSLSEEAQALVEQRDSYIRAIEQLEIRLHQVSGAISEIDSLLKEDNKEVKK